MRNQISYGFLIVLAACNGTRTGNPAGDMNDGKTPDAGGSETDNGGLTGAGGRCKGTPSELDSLTAQSPLGFSAHDVLAFAEGEHQSSIHWHDGSGATPEMGEHDLTVRITRRDAAARFVTYTEAEQSGGGLLDDTDIGLPGPGCEGLNAIEIDVDVDITSDGGALDEHVKAVLSARSTTWANLYLTIAAEDLGGALDVQPDRLGELSFQLRHVSIQIGVSPLGLRGALSGDFTSVGSGDDSMAGTSSNGGVARGGGIADIGDLGCLDGGLPAGADEKLQGFAAQDAIDRINSAQTVRATWQDGTTTDVALSLAHDDQVICAIIDPDQAYAFDGSPPFLRIHALLNAHSDDDRIDAHWPVVVNASPDVDGNLGTIQLAFDDAQLPQAPITDVESAYGISGVDTSAYDEARATLQIELPNGAVADLTGMLIVSGLTQPMCPPPPKDPEMGTPSCRGVDFTQLEQATFTAQ